MKEIINRLHENRQVELAKEILESKGYRVSRKLKEDSKIPHTESYKGYTIQSYNDYGATVYERGKKIQEFENIDDAREYIDELDSPESMQDPQDK